MQPHAPRRDPGLWKAIADVEDPEFQVSIVDMGLVVDIRRANRAVDVDLTLTAMGCPAVDMIVEDVQQRLAEQPDVDSVNVRIVWDPVWTSDRLTPAGRLAFHEMGIAV